MNSRINIRLLLFFLFALVYVQLDGCSKENKEPKPTPTDDTTHTTVVSTDVNLWLTNPSGGIYFKKQNIALNFSNPGNSYPTIEVDTTKSYQTVDGFGFALTGGSAYLINRLPSPQRENLLKELFTSDSTYIGISYLRISIGASDLNSYVYSYDDIATALTDTSLQFFNILPDTYDLIPLLKDITALNPGIKILGSPWSAPAWMKTNKSMMGGSLKPEYYSIYAKYFVKYIQTMKSQGITIDAITPQNEPLNAYNNPSMTMSATEQADFIKNYLGPAFTSANITTKIIVYDHNCDVPSYPLMILKDPAAYKYVAGSAFHLYSGDISALSQVHDAYPEKNVYFTEQWVGGPGNFAADFNWHMKNLIIGAMQNWSKNVIEWNLASDPDYNPHTIGGCTTCLGGLTIGSSVIRNVSYYIVAHASKFVRPGSVRIVSSQASPLPNVAFKTPQGRKVVIVLNESTSSQSFNISFNGKTITATLPGGAAGTYIW
jgi:glucosylceramidase